MIAARRFGAYIAVTEEKLTSTRRKTVGDVVHAIVVRDGPLFVARCVEIAVVTQGRSLDETAEALQEAVALCLDGGDNVALGLVASPRLVIQYETSIAVGGRTP